MEITVFPAYRALFDTPGTGRLAIAGLVARLPLPMMGIGIITLLVQLRGSYALAGAVSATFIATYALLSPRVSRWVDRYGQSRVLPLATAASTAGTLVLILSAHLQAPHWVLFAGALLGGSMPSMSAMLRARWTLLYRGQPRLQTAYALETVLDEVTFIAGPPLAVGLCVAVSPFAGPLAAAVLLVLGVAGLIAQRGTEPPRQLVTAAGAGQSLLARGDMRLLVVLMVAMGVIVGSVDILSVAVAEQRNTPAAASLVLSAYALGSCVAGLLFGTLTLHMPLHRQLLVGAAAVALTSLPLRHADTLPTLALTVLVAGVCFAPTMIVAMSLVERQVPQQRITEGMTWLLAGLNVGVAMGAAGTGHRVDVDGVQAGASLAVVAGVAVLLVALTARRHLQAHSTRPLDAA